MVRIREKNLNTEKYWELEHGDGAIQNKDITPQFERFFVWNFIPTDQSVSVLDIGCGQTLHFKDLPARYPLVRFAGLDFSATAIRKSKELNPLCDYIQKDIMNEDLDQDYDYIVSMHTFEHFEDPVAVLKKCIKHCRKNVIICVPFEDAWGNEESHVHKFTLTDPFTEYKSYRISDNRQEIFFVFSGEASGG